MRASAFALTLFFICLNLSLYVMNETSLMGKLVQPPYEEPSVIIENFIVVDLSANTLMMAGTSLAVGAIVYFLAGKFIYGGSVALLLFMISLLSPLVRWVLFGFPIFLTQIGTPVMIVTVVNVGMSITWFWFLLGIFSSRQLQK